MTTPTQSPPSPAVPEWVLVPRRPTAEMLGATIQRGPLNRTWSLGLVGYQEMLAAAPPPPPAASVDVGALHAEIERLNAIIDTPHTDDFLSAVSIEAEHQRQRWGSEHDAGKAPEDWFWLVGYLAGKALHSTKYGLDEKAMHHVITTAAALYNWHKAMKGETNMRPGIDGESILSQKPAAEQAGGA